MDFRTPPPELFRDTSVEQGKEDDNTMPPLDDEPEEQAHDGPAAVIGAGRGGDVIKAAHEQRHVDFPQPCVTVEDALAEHVDDDRQRGADEEEPQQVPVHGALGEEAARAQGAPNHAGVEAGAEEGAGEAVGGLLGAGAGDVVEGPVEDRHLAEAADDEPHRLDEEEVLGWKLG